MASKTARICRPKLCCTAFRRYKASFLPCISSCNKQATMVRLSLTWMIHVLTLAAVLTSEIGTFVEFIISPKSHPLTIRFSHCRLLNRALWSLDRYSLPPAHPAKLFKNIKQLKPRVLSLMGLVEVLWSWPLVLSIRQSQLSPSTQLLVVFEHPR